MGDVEIVRELPTFVVAVLLLAAVPGPAVAVLVRRSATDGLRGATPLVLGLESGLYFWIVAAGAGLAALVATSHVAYDVLRIVGATVLLRWAFRPGGQRYVVAATDVPTRSTSRSCQQPAAAHRPPGHVRPRAHHQPGQPQGRRLRLRVLSAVPARGLSAAADRGGPGPAAGHGRDGVLPRRRRTRRRAGAWFARSRSVAAWTWCPGPCSSDSACGSRPKPADRPSPRSLRPRRRRAVPTRTAGRRAGGSRRGRAAERRATEPSASSSR